MVVEFHSASHCQKVEVVKIDVSAIPALFRQTTSLILMLATNNPKKLFDSWNAVCLWSFFSIIFFFSIHLTD